MKKFLSLDSNNIRVSSTTELLNENMFDSSVSSEGKMFFLEFAQKVSKPLIIKTKLSTFHVDV
jgi:hypothetical protein